MPRLPKNPYKLVRVRWLDACQHANADSDSEGVARDTVGYLIRDHGAVVRLTNTVDFDVVAGKWVPSDQDDIVDIPKGMIEVPKKYKRE